MEGVGEWLVVVVVVGWCAGWWGVVWLGVCVVVVVVVVVVGMGGCGGWGGGGGGGVEGGGCEQCRNAGVRGASGLVWAQEATRAWGPGGWPCDVLRRRGITRRASSARDRSSCRQRRRRSSSRRECSTIGESSP